MLADDHPPGVYTIAKDDPPARATLGSDSNVVARPQPLAAGEGEEQLRDEQGLVGQQAHSDSLAGSSVKASAVSEQAARQEALG